MAPTTNEAPITQAVPVTTPPVTVPGTASQEQTTQVQTPPPTDPNYHNLSLHDRIKADAANRLKSLDASRGTTASTAIGETSTTPNHVDPIPSTATNPGSIVDDFVLDIDADPLAITTEQPVQTQQVQQVQQQQVAAPATTEAVPGALAEEARPENFSEQDWDVIKKYLQVPASQAVRAQAKIVREISKQPENGGLGYTPAPKEIVNAFQMAHNLRMMTNDFQSGDPQAAETFSRNWLFQGQPDPQTGVAPLRPGATQVVQSIVNHVASHPETVSLLASQLPEVLQRAINNRVPGADKAYMALGNDYFSKLIQSYESALPNLAGKTITVNGPDGNPVQVSGADMVAKVLGYMKEDLGLTKQDSSTIVDPEKEALRKQLEEYKNQGKNKQQQDQQHYIASTVKTVTDLVTRDMEANLDRRLQVLRTHLGDSPESQMEYNIIRNGLRQQVMQTLQTSPVFKGKYQQTLVDVRNGLPPDQLGQGLVRTARQVYGDTLTATGALLIKNRLNQTARVVGATQQTMQQNAQQTAPTTANGRPVIEQNAQQPGNSGGNQMGGGGNAALPPRQFNETMKDYTSRIIASKFQPH